MRVAVLITCYNRVETTLRCLNQLVKQDLPTDCKLDVYLVDDASPDKTGTKVKRWHERLQDSVRVIFNLKIITSQGNLFWCKGMRLAWDTAIESGVDYDYYLWLNDDVELDIDALKVALHDFENLKRKLKESVVITGALASDETRSKVCYSAKYDNGEFVAPINGESTLAPYALNGNFLLVPRDVYEVVGEIYGGYSHGAGDRDYGMQLKKYGYRVYCTSRIVGICPGQPERYLDPRKFSFLKRFRILFDPKGASLHDVFIYRYRNWGIIRACISVVHSTYLTLFPKKG